MSKTARPQAYSEIQKGIGQRIAWVRELVEPNRSEAARMIGTDPSTLTKIENGERAASIFNVIELANRFRVSADFLLRGKLVSETDHELALLLAARHPELVHQLQRKALDKGTPPASDMPARPMKPARTSKPCPPP